MPLLTQEFHMKNRLDIKLRLLLAVLPGVNHLRDGRTSSGIKLLILSCSLLILSILKWKKISSCLNSNTLSSTSSAFIFILLCIFLWSYSWVFALKSRNELHKNLKRKSAFQYALKRFAANKLANTSAYLLLLLFIIAFLAPILAPYDPHIIKDVVTTRYQAPNLNHLFGTDALGRDLFSRALFGARISLSIGVLSVMISMSLGTIYGAIAGFFGGFIDNVLMRFVDIIMAFPIFFLMLLLVGVFDAGITMLILILGLTSWPGTARYIRGEILSLKERGYIESSKAIGLPSHLIIWRHLIPNALSPVLVSTALMIGGMITAEAGLSFLGIGIRPPIPSWGNMISAGQDAVFTGWWIAFFPGLLLTITILCLNLLADGLRDALDTKTLMRKYI
jgi:peptide/nickel transport system permease protein